MLLTFDVIIYYKELKNENKMSFAIRIKQWKHK